MASKSSSSKKFVESLQGDLRSLSNEAKRKFPPVKEAAEAGILRLRTISSKSASGDVIASVTAASADLIQPFVLGCDTKHAKIIPICLSGVQRLISHNAVSKESSSIIINVLWSLMEAGLEELKLLQTAVLLLNTSKDVMHGDMAKALVLCFRLHFTKDPTTMNTAAATIRQLVSVVFERVVVENTTVEARLMSDADMENLKLGGKDPPPTLHPCAQDAFLLFQDLCQLVNADQPFWLLGMTEMTRTFGLELMESVLADYPDVILGHEEFRFLLKERVCPLVIKLFSPSIKYRAGLSISPNTGSNQDKPYFPIVMRLLRIVAVLIKTYYSLLITECEIFLSLLVKFLDGDKPMWQRALAIEVLHKLCVQPLLVQSFVECYDMKQHSTKIFRDIVNAIGTFIQSLFVTPTSSSPGPSASSKTGGVDNANGGPNGNPITGQGSFAYRGIIMPICVTFTPGSTKAVYLEMMDKTENPGVMDGYGIAVAYACLLDVVNTLHLTIQGNNENRDTRGEGLGGRRKLPRSPPSLLGDVDVVKMHEEMIQSSWCGLLAALSFLLDASTEETVIESILKALQIFASMAGCLKLTVPRDAFVTSLCKASLPPHYALTILSQACAGASSGKSPSGGPAESGFEIGMSGGSGGAASAKIGVVTTTNQSTTGANAVDESALLSEGDPRTQQVVAVGNPLPTPYQSSSSAATSGPVMLTAKNLQCMRGLLNMAHCHGAVLGTRCWHLVLTTLQHLVWILGLKPVGGGGGSLKATGTRLNDNSNTVLTNAVMQDLPVLSSMLSRLFESSNLLDDESLQHLIQALGKLSSEASEVAYSNREPSLFPIAKILETGLVNLNRLTVFYKPVTDHLLEVSRHPQTKIREWGAEALTTLIRAALTHEHLPKPLTQNPELQALILQPLEDMSSINFFDSRQKQLDCVLQILNSKGDTLGDGWPLVLGVLGAATQVPAASPTSSESSPQSNLIRSGFQGLQLVVTDFLPTMPKRCLRISVQVTAKYGLQTQDVNISLTSVGLMWNISDFISQRQDFIRKQLETEMVVESDSDDGKLRLPPLDALWLVIYERLGDLCTDDRPAVRKSAGQTLFSTISTHGDLLQSQSWRSVLWHVLFPMLERVRSMSMSASTEKAEVGNILIHHSRDTAKKQWSETQVLTLTGVGRVFSTKRNVLEESLKKRSDEEGVGDVRSDGVRSFLDAWRRLLDFVETSALSPDVEVSLAALESLQEILNIVPEEGFKSSKKTAGRFVEASPSEAPSGLVVDKELWDHVWNVWTSIGLSATTPRSNDADSGKASSESSPSTSSPATAALGTPASKSVYVPSQPFLTALMNVFPVLFSHIKSTFNADDLDRLSRVLKGSLSVPVQGDATPFLVPSFSELCLTPLQEKVLLCTESLKEEILSGTHQDIEAMAPTFANLLLAFSSYSVSPPRFGSMEVHPSTALRPKTVMTADWVAMNYVVFAERALRSAKAFYVATSPRPCVVEAGVATSFVSVLRTPLALKYDCPSTSTWKLAVESLIHVVEATLPIATRSKNDGTGGGGGVADSFWMELAAALGEFWFSPSAAPASLTLEDHRNDEQFDVRLVYLLRDKILSLSSSTTSSAISPPPPTFDAEVMKLLNSGSIHIEAAASAFVDPDSSRKLREDFAKACFQTLLQYSFANPDEERNDNPNNNNAKEGDVSRLAVESLLQRCHQVLTLYVRDEQLSGNCPLPRHRIAELTSVLKAVTLLVATLKSSDIGSVHEQTWRQVIGLYPALVNCIGSGSATLASALSEALIEFHDLLTPPKPGTRIRGRNGGAVSPEGVVLDVTHVANGIGDITLDDSLC